MPKKPSKSAKSTTPTISVMPQFEKMMAHAMWRGMLDAAPLETADGKALNREKMTEDELITSFFAYNQKDSRGKAAHIYGSVENAIKRLSKGTTSKDEIESRRSVLTLASFGMSECLPVIKKAVRNYPGALAPSAITGFSEALAQYPEAAALKPQMVAVILPVFAENYHRNYDELLGFALSGDSPQTLKLILSDKHWRLDNPLLPAFVKALASKNVKVPAAKIRRIIAGTNKPTPELLKCFAISAPEEAEPIIREALTSEPSGYTRELYAEALCAAKGLVGPYRMIAKRWQKFGEEGLSPEERTFQAVLGYYNNCVCGDFCSEMESDDFSRGWNTLCKALADVGASKSARLMRSWAAKITGVKLGEKGFDIGRAEKQYAKKTGRSLTTDFEKVLGQGESEIVTLAYLWLAEHANSVLAAWNSSNCIVND